MCTGSYEVESDLFQTTGFNEHLKFNLFLGLEYKHLSCSKNRFTYQWRLLHLQMQLLLLADLGMVRWTDSK